MKILESPFTKKRENELTAFLAAGNLTIDPHIEKMICFLDEEDKIIACGGIDHGVIKNILVDKNHQHDGHAASLISHLTLLAQANGQTHLTLFTNPINKSIFSALGFTPIVQTNDILFMENKPNGIIHYLDKLPKFAGCNGCIIMNANPITLGHIQLIKYASARCDHLYIFIVEEDRSLFTFQQRISLVQQSIEDIHNASVHSTSKYLISSATFPDYFIKEKVNTDKIHAELDIAIFLKYFVPSLNLAIRFVGSEPFDQVTNAYNKLMHDKFTDTAIKLIEISRFCHDDEIISATKVRKLIQEGNFDDAARYVPKAVNDMMLSMKAREKDA